MVVPTLRSIGDLNSLETITEAITKMAKVAAKVVGLVNPNGITQPRRLNKAATGEF
ncbi:head-to-tail connector protein [Enterobacter phage 04_vB_Eclo_IJM]|nr:head-to-tail connector protein [Enterobacter phage 04_vB_Eclo_IJM]